MINWSDRLIDPILFNIFMHASVIKRYNNVEFNEWLKKNWDSAKRTLARRESLHLLPKFFVEYVLLTLNGGAAN